MSSMSMNATLNSVLLSSALNYGVDMVDLQYGERGGCDDTPMG